MSVPLVVPPPALAFDAIDGLLAPVDGKVTVSFAAVLFPDGTPVTLAEVVAARALLTRVSSGSGVVDVWDPATKSWQLEGTTDPALIEGVALAPPRAGAEPWEGILVGAGETDVTGAPMLAPAVGHFPQYRLRGVFQARREAEHAFGVGPDSAPIEFVSLLAAQRFGAELTPNPAAATLVRLGLKNASGAVVGSLEIDASGGGAAITISTLTAAGTPLAALTLQADGAIRLTPSAGQKVLVDGDLETRHIRYVPAVGFLAQDLN